VLQPTTLSLCGLCTAAVRTADKFFVAIYRFQFILSQKNSHTSTGSQTHNPDSPTPYTTMHQLYQLYNAQIGAPPCHRTTQRTHTETECQLFFLSRNDNTAAQSVQCYSRRRFHFAAYVQPLSGQLISCL